MKLAGFYIKIFFLFQAFDPITRKNEFSIATGMAYFSFLSLKKYVLHKWPKNFFT